MQEVGRVGIEGDGVRASLCLKQTMRSKHQPDDEIAWPHLLLCSLALNRPHSLLSIPALRHRRQRAHLAQHVSSLGARRCTWCLVAHPLRYLRPISQ